MRCEAPRGHDQVLRGLWRAARAGRLAHALLFVGPEGVGKFVSAEWLTFGLLCASGPAEPCGTCGPCKRLKAESHADVFVIDAEAEGEEQIEISRIVARQDKPRPNITDFLELLPMEGGWRIVLMRDAHRMNRESQNALLKTLEEPGAQTLLVLETSRPDLLLSTTHSRCVRVPFRAPERADAVLVLRGHGVEEGEAEALARWSGGAPGAALAARSRGAIAMRTLIARALAGAVDPFAALRELAEIEGTFPGRTAAAIARSRARAFLDLALAVVADLRRHAAGLDPSELAHGDLAAELGAREALRAAQLEQCLAARQDVDQNLAPEAALERALLGLCDALRPRNAGRSIHRGEPVRYP